MPPLDLHALAVDVIARQLRVEDVASLGDAAAPWDDLPEKNRDSYRRLAERELAKGGGADPTTAPPPAQTLTRGARTMTDTSDTQAQPIAGAQPDGVSIDVQEWLAANPAPDPDAGTIPATADAEPAAETPPPPTPDEIQQAKDDAPSRDAYGAGEQPGAPMSVEQLTEAVVILAGAVSMQRISAKVRTAVSDIAGWPRDGVPSAELADAISAQSDAIDVVGEVAAAALLQGDARDALADGLADQLSRAQALGAIKPGQVITEAVLQSVSIDAGGLGTIDAIGPGTPVADLEPVRWEPSDLVAPGQPVTFGVLAHRDETIIRPEFAALLAEPLRLIPDGVATQELVAPAVPTMEQMVDRGAEALAAVYGPADDWRIMAATVITAVKNLVNGR